jgi:hypothetical protein
VIKNNCLEKENLRIQVEQTKTDQRKSQKAANTEKSGIPCDNKTGQLDRSGFRS